MTLPNLPVNTGLTSYELSFYPTGVAATDTPALEALIDSVGTGATVRIKIRDNGSPVRLGRPSVYGVKSIKQKSIFFVGENPNVKVIWGVPGGTGVQGLYSIEMGASQTDSPIVQGNTMPAWVTRVGMNSLLAKYSKITSPNVALTKGDRVLIWSDDVIADANAHTLGGTQRPGELHRVEYNSSGNDYVLDSHTYDALTVNPRIAKITMQKNCGWANLTFGYEGPASASRTGTWYAIYMSMLERPILENIFMDNTGFGSIGLHLCDSARITGIHQESHEYNIGTDGEYGIVDITNRDLLVEDCHFRFLRHGYTTGGWSDSSKEWLVSNNASGGTYTITLNGQTTAGIAYNATAATVQTALEGLAGVGAGQVTVTAFGGGAGFPYRISTGGTLATVNNVLTASGASLTGGTLTLTSGTARYGNSRGTLVRNCKMSVGGSSYPKHAAFDTHAEGVEIRFEQCAVEFGAQDNASVGSIGFINRSRGTIYDGCRVFGNQQRVTASVPQLIVAFNDQGADTKIMNCVVRDVFEGVRIESDGQNRDNHLIMNNVFQRVYGGAVTSDTAQLGTSYGVTDNIMIFDNVFSDCGRYTGSSPGSRAAIIRIATGTGHCIRGNHLDKFTADANSNRYSLDFDDLTSTNVDVLGNYMRGYDAANTPAWTGTNMGLYGETGNPHATAEATADAIATKYESKNYLTP